ncbi:trypsin-like serine protease [Corynebacterium glutamicum]|uniref:trypsin-like serine protease n=1 Tax=Corynebacterium glutamicum TaxID=1718 RepID=UPI0012DA2A01|nr:trypsin-like serine protease [Corynebacterium glutamicum]
MQQHRFEYVYQTAANEQHRACPGDSGGPVFVGDVIYAVHSGGEFTPVCSDKHGTLGFVAALYPKLDEIEAIVKDNDQQEAASLSGFSPSSSGTIGGLVNSLSSEKPLS